MKPFHIALAAVLIGGASLVAADAALFSGTADNTQRVMRSGKGDRLDMGSLTSRPSGVTHVWHDHEAGVSYVSRQQPARSAMSETQIAFGKN